MQKSKVRKIMPVILAGGSGVRLWPLSRRNFPKFALQNDKSDSFLQDTVNRISESDIFEEPIILSHQNTQWLIKRQVNFKLIIEPSIKNTGPAIAAACLLYPDEIMLVLPSDHKIDGDFISNIEIAVKNNSFNKIILFGIKPEYRSSHYGHIIRGDKKSVFHEVSSFVEKPDYIEGSYLWHTGILLFSAKDMIRELDLYQPDMMKNIRKSISLSKSRGKDILLGASSYNEVLFKSIDKAVLEKTKNALVYEADFSWADVGDFSSLRIHAHEGNDAIKGDGVFFNSKNSYINSDKIFTACIGVNDLSIISTRDAVLVFSNKAAEHVPKIVNYLEKENRKELINGQCEYRPWGYFEVLYKNAICKIKKIILYQSASISLQRHHHRNEQWIVIKGSARAIIGDSLLELAVGDSVTISKGTKHRLINTSEKSMLEIIEVQTGEILDENDIERFDDDYGRIT